MLDRALRAICLLLCLVTALACRAPVPVAPADQAASTSVAGNVIVLPDDGRDELLRYLGSARTSIDVFAYLFSDRPTAEALAAAVRRGVNVRVLLERDPFGGDNSQAFARLRGLGLTVRESSPTFRYSHAKVVLIDERIALIGTSNYTRTSFERNREFIAVVEDKAVISSLRRLFEADWSQQPTPELHPALVVSPENSRRQLTSLVDQALETLLIYQSDTGDERFADAIARASQRGVEVRYITNPVEPDQVARSGRLLERMREAGASIGFLSAPFVHAKVVLVDDRIVAIGSINSTPTSFDQNREVGILLDDPEAIQTVRSTFERDWSATQ